MKSTSFFLCHFNTLSFYSIVKIMFLGLMNCLLLIVSYMYLLRVVLFMYMYVCMYVYMYTCCMSPFMALFFI